MRLLEHRIRRFRRSCRFLVVFGPNRFVECA